MLKREVEAITLHITEVVNPGRAQEAPVTLYDGRKRLDFPPS